MFRKSSHAILMLSSIFLTACASTSFTDTDFKRAEQSAFNQQIETQDIQFDPRAEQWWLKFGDPLLSKLVGLTLENNQSLKAVEANVKAAYALFKDAKTGSWPQGSAGLDYSRQNQAIPGFNTERVEISSYRAGAQLSWNIDLFGKIRQTAKAVLADAETQYYQWHDLQLSLTAQVAQTYAQIKGLKARIIVAQKNIDSLEQMRSITETRFNAGFASQLDLHRIDAQLFSVKASIPQLNAAFERAKNMLSAMVGGNSALGTIDLDNMNQALPGLDAPLAIGDPKQLLRRRADVFAAESQLIAASARLKASVAALYPDLSVTGFLGYLAGSSSVLVDSDSKAWSVAPSLSWSIFSLASLRAKVDVASAREEAALANFNDKILYVLADAKSALSDYSERQKQTLFIGSQARASNEALKIAKQQYEAGMIDLFELLDVERSFLAAEDSLISTKVSAFTAIVEVYKTFGGDFDVDSDKKNVSQL